MELGSSTPSLLAILLSPKNNFSGQAPTGLLEYYCSHSLVLHPSDKPQTFKSLKNLLKNIKSPGQLGFHYSPGIPVRLNVKYPKKNEAFLQFFGKTKNKNNYFALSKKRNMREAAKNLFSILRLIKKKGYSSIAVSKIPSRGLGLAINDRLKKASHK